MMESKKIDKPCEPEHGGCGEMMEGVDKNRKICTKCRRRKGVEAARLKAQMKKAAK